MSKTTTGCDPKMLVPGTMIEHVPSGTRYALKERKADDSGWWLMDGGGLVDGAWNDHGYTDWEALGFPCSACHGTGIEASRPVAGLATADPLAPEIIAPTTIGHGSGKRVSGVRPDEGGPA